MRRAADSDTRIARNAHPTQFVFNKRADEQSSRGRPVVRSTTHDPVVVVRLGRSFRRQSPVPA
jgi:hypothetical protein